MDDKIEYKQCLNCGSSLSGNYCSNCGQSASVDRISFRDTLSDFFSASFALEGPLMRTIKLMIVNPGKLCHEFLAGRRKRYYKPVAFFILLTAIYIIIRSLLDYNPVEENMQTFENADRSDASRFKEAGLFMFRYINNFLFLLVFGIAFSFKLFFWKQYRLAEYIAVGFFVVGIYILFGTFSMILNHFTLANLRSLHLWFLIIYIAISSISFFKHRSFRVISKSVLVAIFSLIIYMSLAFGLSLIIVLLK